MSETSAVPVVPGGAAPPPGTGAFTSELAASVAEDVLARFCRYVRIDTQSRRDAGRSPSTPGQLELGRLLVEELSAIGCSDARLDEHGYVYATLPASGGGSQKTVIGLLAHMDTSPDAAGEGVEPIVHRAWSGGVIELPRDGTRLDPAAMPALAGRAGDDIVTGSGDTLLGADDKAGVAVVMATVAHLAAHPELPRPTLRIGFTPDEEIGEGATHFDIAGFGARCAYTLDGSGLGGLEDESFSAVEMVIRIDGVDIHPGQAHGRMVDALRLAADILAELPSDRLTPATSGGRAGFIHPYEVAATPARAEVRAIVRDFDDELLAGHVDLLEQTARTVVAGAPGARLDVQSTRQYSNMRPFIEHDPSVVAAAERAIRAEGIEPRRDPIRGGTDGSRLSELGLPTPNIFTGAHDFHSVHEWASLQEMAASVAVCVRLAGVWEESAGADAKPAGAGSVGGFAGAKPPEVSG